MHRDLKIEELCYNEDRENQLVRVRKEKQTMAKWVCNVCGYVYDPEVGDPDNGVEAGTAWEDVPADWVCPLCGVGKDDFSEE